MAGIIFRADDMVKAMQMAARMVTPRDGAIVVNELVISTLPLSLSLYGAFLTCKTLFERSNVVVLHKLKDWWLHSTPAQVVVYASMALVILGFAPMQVSPFIYFQF
jgi:hypothetical protein